MRKPFLTGNKWVSDDWKLICLDLLYKWVCMDHSRSNGWISHLRENLWCLSFWIQLIRLMWWPQVLPLFLPQSQLVLQSYGWRREVDKMEHLRTRAPHLLGAFPQEGREPFSHTLLASSVFGYNENLIHHGSRETGTVEKGNSELYLEWREESPTLLIALGFAWETGLGGKHSQTMVTELGISS